MLMVTQTDLVSLWSAGRIRTFLEEGNSRIRPRLVMNRYKKLLGFTEDDIEKVTNCKVLSKIPDSYMVGLAIDKGVPVVFQDKHGVGQSFVSLAKLLAAEEESGEDGWPSPPRGSEPPGGSSAPAVPVGLPRSGGPRTLPPRKVA